MDLSRRQFLSNLATRKNVVKAASCLMSGAGVLLELTGSATEVSAEEAGAALSTRRQAAMHKIQTVPSSNNPPAETEITAEADVESVLLNLRELRSQSHGTQS